MRTFAQRSIHVGSYARSVRWFSFQVALLPVAALAAGPTATLLLLTLVLA